MSKLFLPKKKDKSPAKEETKSVVAKISQTGGSEAAMKQSNKSSGLQSRLISLFTKKSSKSKEQQLQQQSAAKQDE